MVMSDAATDFVAKVAAYWENGGLTHAAGAILGHLMVCEPAQQTQAEIAAALSLSTGSVSTQLGVLVRAGLVERVRPLGSRTLAFQLPENMWVRAMESEPQRIAGLRTLADLGLRALPASRRDRIASLDVMVRFWEREWPQLEARFNAFVREETE
jgi:hypothetical protein